MIIEAHDITKEYGDQRVLDGVSLAVEEGEVLGIIGPSGSGKSTFLRILDLIEAPTSGELSLFGEDVLSMQNRWLEIRRRMGMLFQKPIVFNASVYDNVAMGMRYRSENRAEIDRRVQETLEAVGLSRYIKSSARDLSGGEQQRVALSRVIVTEPEILFLDEPTANLDPASTATIEEMVLRLNRERGTTIVVNTHDMLQGQRLSQRVGVMIAGDIMQVGKPKEVFNNPANLQIARFVGVDNILSGRVASAEPGGLTVIEVQGNRLEVAEPPPDGKGRAVKVVFRGEDVTIGVGETATTSARNVFSGSITGIESTAPFVGVTVDCGFPVTALVTARSADSMDLEAGKEVWVSFKASALHLIAEEQDGGDER
ncbi:ABC transporter ATP-binding protein [Methanoculleus sp. FWC-SCC1]|uniref:Molybdate/tungstate import ATP-binding protein WtpC n=1 Tax=Methanoculleus frigidifontis TaxID=2584085 RepID=A0ABT8MCE2_9EURY|nr:ABC transporter ATP-binding protein [Methanoculleus sp. FWC-SCC1]MDN7025592.1 ABC transporter ATP-binding protein [Methanoculleus sp. FWC-SCC1]